MITVVVVVFGLLLGTTVLLIRDNREITKRIESIEAVVTDLQPPKALPPKKEVKLFNVPARRMCSQALCANGAAKTCKNGQCPGCCKDTCDCNFFGFLSK